jgi:2-haloacid dehalogenase
MRLTNCLQEFLRTAAAKPALLIPPWYRIKRLCEGLILKPVLLFDVNETLLNVDALRPAFLRIFGDENVLKEWFDAVLLYSQTLTIISVYRDFSVLAEDALRMVASTRQQDLSREDVKEVLEGIRSLPPHPEVLLALRRLKAGGFRLAALTNSSKQAVQAQLANAGLHDLFENVMSVDAVGKFKPALETYAYACSTLLVAPKGTMLVAAHPWDVQGAMRAGLRGAFLKRSGKSWFGDDPKPEFESSNLAELADRLLLLD